MTGYRLSRAAERDLFDIVRYFAHQASDEIAAAVLERLLDTIVVIAANPGIGLQQEIFGRGIRSFTSEKFKVYYRKQKVGILVLHVFHGARDQKRAWMR